MTEELTGREKRQARTRDSILNAAIELIMEDGIDNLQMRELAKRVDYSIGGLYAYFGSKEEIVGAVCMEGDRRLMEYMKAVPSTLSFKDYLLELGLAYIKFAQQNPHHFSILFSTRTLEMEAPVSPDAEELQGSFGILMAAVVQGIETGQIQAAENHGPWEVAYSLWAIVHGMATLETTYLSNFRFDFEAANRRGLEAFVTGLLTA
jgi:AcrR family transcriptional regulator